MPVTVDLQQVEGSETVEGDRLTARQKQKGARHVHSLYYIY